MMVYCVKKLDVIVYIGMTTLDLVKRRRCHLYKATKGRGALLGAAIRLNGPDCFKWEQLKQCSSTSEASEMEKHLISKLKPIYNTQEGGSNGFTPHNKGKKISDCLRKKLKFAAWKKSQLQKQKTSSV